MVDVTSIGTNSGTVVSTVVVTVPTGGVPAGSLIIVCVGDSSLTGSGAVADTAGNSYTATALTAMNGAQATNGFCAMFHVWNSKALVSGNTITYTLGAASRNAAVSAFYATSIRQFANPLDATLGGVGSSTSPSVGSSNPSVQGELIVGIFADTGGSGETFTQDSTNAAWANFPVRVGTATGPTVAGGAITRTSKTSVTYNPTIGTTHPWGAIISMFIPAQPAYTTKTNYASLLAQ